MDYLIPAVGGLLATLCMSLFMAAVTKSGLANADMIRAVGSLFTKSVDNAFWPGLVIHFFSGMGFAYGYAVALSIFPIGIISSIGVGAALGGFQGLAVAFVLVAMVAENHPVTDFRSSGGRIAFSHFLGHVVYGCVIGATIGITGFDMLANVR